MNTPEETERMLCAETYAVIGASRDTEKVGHQVWRALKSDGKTAYAVNPNTDMIGKSPCYHRLRDLPGLVEVVVYVVPPHVTMETLPDVATLGIKDVWMQSGAESDEAVAYCAANGLALVTGKCIMTELWGDIDID